MPQHDIKNEFGPAKYYKMCELKHKKLVITAIKINRRDEHFCVGPLSFHYIRDNLFDEATDSVILQGKDSALQFNKLEFGTWINGKHIFSSGSLACFIENTIYNQRGVNMMKK